MAPAGCVWRPISTVPPATHGSPPYVLLTHLAGPSLGFRAKNYVVPVGPMGLPPCCRATGTDMLMNRLRLLDGPATLHWDGRALHGTATSRGVVVTVPARFVSFRFEDLPPAAEPPL